MPIYKLSQELIFPHPELSNKDGILAIGGDLSKERLLLAYKNGIFPWFSDDEPLIWWSPNPRFVLFPNELKISTSMKKFLKKNSYTVTFDTCFDCVINMCSKLRTGNTWITNSIIESYIALFEAGYAHSVETWYGDKLVGGIYGVSLGKCFFGESMFSIMDNSSKTAMIALVQKLIQKDFLMIDCQVYSKHLESLGAINLPRKHFLKHLEKGLKSETLCGNWGTLLF